MNGFVRGQSVPPPSQQPFWLLEAGPLAGQWLASGQRLASVGIHKDQSIFSQLWGLSVTPLGCHTSPPALRTPGLCGGVLCCPTFCPVQFKNSLLPIYLSRILVLLGGPFFEPWWGFHQNYRGEGEWMECGGTAAMVALVLANRQMAREEPMFRALWCGFVVWVVFD